MRAWLLAAAAVSGGVDVRADPSTSCVTADLDAARGAKPTFDPGHARLTDAGKVALRPVADALHARPKLRLAITGHFTADILKGPADVMAKRRAEVVKWYLVDTGVAADRIETSVSSTVVPGRAVDVRFAMDAAPPCATKTSRVADNAPAKTARVTAPQIDPQPAWPADGHRVIGVDLEQMIATSRAHPVAIGSSDSGPRGREPPRVGEHITVRLPTDVQPPPANLDETTYAVTFHAPRPGPTLPAPEAVVTQINTGYMPGLIHCYRKARRANPGISGRVSLTFSVDDAGHVTAGTAQGLDDDLDACITGQMARWRFSTLRGGDDAPVFSMTLAVQTP